MCVYLLTKFQVSSIANSNKFWTGVNPPTLERTHKKPTQIRVKNVYAPFKNFRKSKDNDHILYYSINMLRYKALFS